MSSAMQEPESEVLLIGAFGSMYAIRVQIALAEKGIKYDYIEEDLTAKSPFLLKHNPVYKKVPVLVHKGKPVCESLIIVQYIDETWKEGFPLLPSDPYLKSQAAFWADYIDRYVLEKELGEKPYFNGESFGFVDMALVCYYNCFIAVGPYGNFSIEKECPKLVVWAKQCMKRESVSKSLLDPNKLNEIILTIKKKNSLKG
ncbi:hypothetical protein E3N88_06246 [Mikania micrantha]|uniref:glutathione transferase n=1 Tax=Mikania micrantha TaxID=192012 RepID=A0A5N6PQJ7_9ASTR|nr:hypothetical protein E3N88_06246 [Mikania micrantha]